MWSAPRSRTPTSTICSALSPDPEPALSADRIWQEGIRLTEVGRLREAEAPLRLALAANPQSPDIRLTLGMNLLAQGRYDEGWPLYDARIALNALNDAVPRSLPFPRWSGEDVAGRRIALFPEQGWGDQIQFARFVPELRRRGAVVSWLVHPSLLRLFQHSFPGIDIIPATGETRFPDPDAWLTLVDLPYCLGITLENLPAEPYIDTAVQWSNAPQGLRVGLVTRGGSRFLDDARRSLPPAKAEYLERHLPGSLVSLHPEQSGVRDFADTAAIIRQLDLVVSVDTAVAHLAGAMGKPCLLLLPGFRTDWRWMRERSDSPWYPGHRLYRANADGNWDEALARLIEDAQSMASTTPASD
jgi:hypothetical protein